MSSKPRPPNGDPITVRKSDLMKMLREEHGLSKRKAAAGVNAVFDCMARALRRGENVELPVGEMHVVSQQARRKPQLLQRFRNIQTGEIFSTIVHHPRRLIRFTPDPKQILRGRDAVTPPRPLPAEMVRKGEELEKSFSRLTGREITVPDLESLLAAVVDENKEWIEANRQEYIDRLLARLRQIILEQRPFDNLADTVRQMYWIR